MGDQCLVDEPTEPLSFVHSSPVRGQAEGKLEPIPVKPFGSNKSKGSLSFLLSRRKALEPGC